MLLAGGGCATLGWYGQAARGQMELLLKRKDIEKLIAAPDTPKQKREKLELVLEIREFAGSELGLPDNGSYSGFVRLERDAVVYNVVAVPEFSVAPRPGAIRWSAASPTAATSTAARPGGGRTNLPSAASTPWCPRWPPIPR